MELDIFLGQVIGQSPQHRVFYHFTDKRNLDGIRAHGLLSSQEIIRRGLQVPAPGGNDWSRTADNQAGMDRYVHLCFFREHPMEWQARQEERIGETVFLRINPEIIKTAGALVTDAVSNKNGVVPRSPQVMLEELDLEVIYKRTDWRDSTIKERLKVAKLYEILIPDHIPVNMISRLDNG